jgi:hypothetical protein
MAVQRVTIEHPYPKFKGDQTDEQIKQRVAGSLRRGFNPQWYIRSYPQERYESGSHRMLLGFYKSPFSHFQKLEDGMLPEFFVNLYSDKMQVNLLLSPSASRIMRGPGIPVLYQSLSDKPEIFTTTDRGYHIDITQGMGKYPYIENSVNAENKSAARALLRTLSDDIAKNPTKYEFDSHSMLWSIPISAGQR